jgi:hypothetical protein
MRSFSQPEQDYIYSLVCSFSQPGPREAIYSLVDSFSQPEPGLVDSFSQPEPGLAAATLVNWNRNVLR